MFRPALLWVLVLFSSAMPSLWAQTSAPDQVQVNPPVPRAEPPSPSASVEELERQGDELRANKAYLDALDYYHVALKKEPNNAHIYNKAGIAELQMQRHKQARKNFERAIKADPQFADAYNNLGAVYYQQKKYGGAIKRYEQALQLRSDVATYYGNLGAAYFAKKDFDRAALNYSKALELDPDVFERHSRAGISAQLPTPEDRAHYAYVMAKLYAKAGIAERSLQFLRRALEEGYSGIDQVYKDAEFAELRKDPRFTALMSTRPSAIPQ